MKRKHSAGQTVVCSEKAGHMQGVLCVEMAKWEMQKANTPTYIHVEHMPVQCSRTLSNNVIKTVFITN